MNDLEEAIFTVLTNDAGLMAKLTNGESVYAYRAPENAVPPLIILFEQTEGDIYTLQERAMREWLYAVKVITKGNSFREAWEIDEVIDSLLTDATLTMNGGTALSCRRESAIPPYTEMLEGVRYNHAGGSYRIWT
jgi:Protein of unknown function (DUF3168)